MDIKKDAYIYTPRFCTVRVSEVYESEIELITAGYSEPTYYDDGRWTIRGRSIGLNRMIFAASRIKEGDISNV